MTTKEAEAKNTWITNKSGRAQFWAAVDSVGLNREGAHELFGIESMYEYEGTLAEAIGVVRAWEAEHSPPAAEQPPLPEQPEAEPEPEKANNYNMAVLEASTVPPVHSFSTKGYKDGYYCIVKIESHDTGDLLRRGAKMLEYLKAHGYEPTYFSNGNGKPAAKQATSQPPLAGNGADKTFEAAHLVGSVTDGKEYWKVKGGKFSQWGVTIWPEVLEEAGFDVNLLSPTEQYDLNGYTAHYVENDKGNPQKVTRLAKGA